MAESNQTSVVIEYSKPGAEPPIYVAGSFSSWQPLQMDVTDDGEHGRKFTKQLEVEEGKEYQYKFRLGDGNWWELDESGPTGTISPFSIFLVNFPTLSSQYTVERLEKCSFVILREVV